MIDSNNIEIIRDNLKELDQKIENLDVEIPPHTSSDAGKYLGVDSSGDLEFSNPLPAHPSTDAGKYLGVDSSGDLEFSSPLPDTTTATVGQILTLDLNKDPEWDDRYLNYSETEQDTGVKWINGKTIYRKVITGTISTTESDTEVDLSALDFDNIWIDGCSCVEITGHVFNWGFNTSTVSRFTGYILKNTKKILIYSTNYNGDYTFIIYYTKPTPTPETLTKKKKSK